MIETTKAGQAGFHCLEYSGRKFVYVSRTGDLMEPEPIAFEALRLVEQGVSMTGAASALAQQFGLEAAGECMAQIEGFLDIGYAEDEPRLGEEGLSREIDSYLSHKPRNLMLLVTEACNLACTYCYEEIQGVHKRATMMTVEHARQLIDRYLEDNGDRDGATITFFGGEPLLNERVLRDGVAYAKQRGEELGKAIDFTMTTNLTLLTEEHAEFLAQNRFHVMVSLDGDREANDRYRRTVKGEGTYDTVVANLQILIAAMKRHGVRLPKIRATMTAENTDRRAIEEHLRSLGTPLVMVGDTHGTVHAGKAEHDVKQEDGELEEKIDERRREVEHQLAALDAAPDGPMTLEQGVLDALRKVHGEVVRPEPHAKVTPQLCGVCRNMRAVTPKGDTYPCHRFVGMEAFNMGNMLDGTEDPEKKRRFYERVLDVYEDHCSKCWARHLCGGVCSWYQATPEGEILEPEQEFCDGLRAGYEQALGIYATALTRYPRAFERITEATSDSVGGCSSQPLSAER
ncbi:MAG: radical SAM protein [Planctomycetota bacterium]